MIVLPFASLLRGEESSAERRDSASRRSLSSLRNPTTRAKKTPDAICNWIEINRNSINFIRQNIEIHLEKIHFI